MNKSKKQPSFEESLQRLETIVKEMETGSLGLDEMTRKFEEGQNLIDFCTKKLNEVEQKVEKLVKRGGEIISEPLETPEEQTGDGEDKDGEEDGGGG